MVESEADSRQKMCGSKLQFDDYDEALDWGIENNRKYNQDTVWDAYLCKYCNKWHLTKT